MSMRKLISILFLSILFLNSCSKDNSTGPEVEVVQDNFKPPYTVKYEVTFSSSSTKQTPCIEYSFEDLQGNFRLASEFLSNPVLVGGWSKEFTVTVVNNPLALICDLSYYPNEDGWSNIKMYVNNVLVSEKKWNNSSSSSCFFDCCYYKYLYYLY